MESKMEILVEVSYRHGYFSNGICRCLSTRLAGGGDRELINQDLLWKERPGGFILAYDTRHAGRLRSREEVLGRQLVIRFLLILNDPSLYNYTTPIPEEITRQVYYFYNEEGRSVLQRSAVVSREDLYFFQRRRLPAAPDMSPGGEGGETDRRVAAVKDERDHAGSKWVLEGKAGEGRSIILEDREGGWQGKPFAILDLRLESWMDRKYEILFQPCATRWNYILAGDHLQQLHAPAILNSRTRECFSGPSVVRLAGERAGLSFVSPASIDLSEDPSENYMLVENYDLATGKYKVVVPALPRPDPRIISRVRRPEKKEGGEDEKGRGEEGQGAAADDGQRRGMDEGQNDLFSEIILY